MEARLRRGDREPAGPLAGRRIILTRPHNQAASFETRIHALGGIPVVAPAIAIAEPLSWVVADRALTRIDDYDWVAFTSANAVRALADRARRIELDPARIGRRHLAAVGAATAAALTAAMRAPDFVATVHAADALARQIPAAPDSRVLFPTSAIAGDTLPVVLRERDIRVDIVVVYRTVAGEGVPAVVTALRAGDADAVLFASPSAVSFVAQALGDSGQVARRTADDLGVPIFCLGPTTEAAARAAGFHLAVSASAATQDELIDEVARWFARTPVRATGHGGT